MIGGIRVGDLDRLLVFEERTATTSATGSVEYTWIRAFGGWGKFVAVRGSEKNENNQPLHEETFRVMVRARNGYNTKQRLRDIRYNEYWYITGITRNQREYCMLDVSRKDNQTS